MAKTKTAADSPIDEATQTDAGALSDAEARAAADQAKADAEAQAAADQAKADAAAKPAPEQADAKADAQLTAPLWEPHEEVPAQGGSFVRQPDGSLAKSDNGADAAEKGEA